MTRAGRTGQGADAPGPDGPRSERHEPLPHSAADLAARALEAAAQARAPSVHASTAMVRKLSVRMVRQLGLDERHQALVDICARVRDIGMIGLPDEVVLASGPLTPDQWTLVNQHPVLGAELLARLPGMEIVAEIVRAHHERWDGDGYPDGLGGEAIPVLSRVLGVADAFVSIASDRPHRRAAGADVALEHITGQAGTQFDPHVVEALTSVLEGRAAASLAPTPAPEEQPAPRPAPGPGDVMRRGRSALTGAVQEFDLIPAFTPPWERARTALAAETPGAGGDLVAAIESDTGLTVAVLRAARGVRTRRSIVNVPDAVAALGDEGVSEAIGAVPRVAFPWRTPEQALLHHIRVHGQTVARAAERLAAEVSFGDRDDLIGAALLHDVGKLVLARVARADALPDERLEAPEQRAREERRRFTLDHASVGALLIGRWGLADRLGDAIGAHHSADDGLEVATLLRLADMVARHAHGHTVDRRVMLRLAGACGLPVPTLRDVMFDLPQSGSQRRRAQPSPLSKRETDALRQLAAGKVYKDIAVEMGVSISTIRSHLHSSYAKLEVEDRAHAVLRATEMGWI